VAERTGSIRPGNPDERVRDALPVNLPYEGLVAEAYDVWLPPGPEYDDVPLWRELVRQGDGPALELGCGNGRLLVRFRRDGLDVEGVDSSADMLDRCRRHAEAAGVTVTLHHADWATLDLGRTYATVYNPIGSFLLLHDEADARRALAAWRAHVRPGGSLVISMAEPDPERADDWTWRVRRSATRETDGVTFMVHEAIEPPREAGIEVSLHRHEVWEPDGTLRTTFVRRHRLRSWPRADLAAALRESGFDDVETPGDERGYLAIGRVT
jgi:SAM-dependent methyltransferase